MAVGAMAAEPQYQWRRTDSSLALAAGDRVVWQLTFNKEEGKPYFHPLSLADGTVLTALRPADHPWHRGLWWSWKYINGINYWEEDKAGQSQGRTELDGVRVESNADYSARVEMELSYHPSGKPAVLTEKRVLSVSAPDARGNYSIDWESAFTAGAENLKLDRTPPQNWAGGYAGLGLRLAAATKRWTFTSSEGAAGATNIYGQRARWLDFSGRGGVTLFDSPQNPRHPTAWYPNSSMPWCTPAFLFHEPYELAAGAILNLRYRVLVHSEPMDQAAIDRQWASFTNRANAKRILVYTRNGLGLNGKPGYVHDNIASSIAALRQLGDEHGFAVDASDDPKCFTDANLKKYRALVFSNSNNESFENEAQKSALQNYIHAGGGFVGIHSACGSNGTGHGFGRCSAAPSSGIRQCSPSPSRWWTAATLRPPF